MPQLMAVWNLRVWFNVRMGIIAGVLGREVKHIRAVDGISFDVRRGEVFCLVGESGCGKTTTGKALIKLNNPTGGSVFFDVPEEDWARFVAMERRYRELQSVVRKSASVDWNAADAAWAQIRNLTGQIAQTRSPLGNPATRARRERYDKTKAFLDEHEQDLLKGTDRAITRIMSKDRRRLELMQTYGDWFTPARAQRLERLEKDLKEAKYRALRAEALEERKGKIERRVRRLERKIERMRSHIETGNPETGQRIKELDQAIVEKQKHLTDLEVARVRQERDRMTVPPVPEAPAYTSAADNQIGRMESTIADIRARGGPALELVELHARLNDVAARYDLVRWTGMGRATSKQRMRELRRRMQIIYQDPYESMNPKLSIYDIVSEPLLANHVLASKAEAQAVVAKALEDVGLRPANEYMFRYPHELSGGQRQRVGIATALVVDPDFIVADEPVSMLDASVRTEILALLLDLKKRRNLTYLFITHDLGLAWIIADRIAVMYLGKVVETGNAPEIIQNPRHPYTKALISVVPSPNPTIHREKMILRGERPNPADIPTGCRFHPRCPVAVSICGWDSDEVRAELQKILAEDQKTVEAAKSISEMIPLGPFKLGVITTDPANVNAYLRKRLRERGPQRPVLGAVRATATARAAVILTIREPVQPRLQYIKGDVAVACHLVEPETGNVPAPVPAAVAPMD